MEVTSEQWIQRERNCQPSRGARPPSLPSRGTRPSSLVNLTQPNPTQRVSFSFQIQCSEVTAERETERERGIRTSVHYLYISTSVTAKT